jgi:hypothetical protein
MNKSRRFAISLSLGLLVIIGISLEAQINNSLYFMPGVPQSNRVNPANQPHCQFYIGLPLLSPVRVELSSSAVAYGDVIYPHPREDSLITFLHPLGNKQAFIDLLEPLNYVVSDMGTSLVSFGFHTEVGFFSMDITTRLDGNIYYPGDMARLILGGTEEGETYQFDGAALDLSAFDEISVGWTGKILHNLQVGARGKMLFGVGNLSTKRSELELTTSEDVWNIRSDMMFNASLPFAEVQYDEEGNFEDIILKEDIEDFNPWKLPKYMFNGKNLGMGIDIGVNYRPMHELLVSASVMDIGFIKWKDEVHEVTYNTAFDYLGLELNPFDIPDGVTLGEHLDSLVNETVDSISSFLVFTPGNFYSKRLNTKLYIGASYNVTPKISFGLLSRTDFLKDKVSQQFTASANLTTGRAVNFTMSYSYMNAYFKNIGAGVSFNLGPVNMYLLSDNALNVLFWPQEVKSVNLWFGMNLVFGYKKFMANLYRDNPLIY